MRTQLINENQAKALMNNLWPKVLEALNAGKKLNLEIKAARRSHGQNDMFHALIYKITKEMGKVGSTWSAEDWKRLLIDQWAKDTNRKIGQVVASLDGERLVQLGIQSHKFSVEEGSEFIEWLQAWMADKGIDDDTR